MARLQAHLHLRLSVHSLQKSASVSREELCISVLQACDRRRGQSCSGTLTSQPRRVRDLNPCAPEHVYRYGWYTQTFYLHPSQNRVKLLFHRDHHASSTSLPSASIPHQSMLYGFLRTVRVHGLLPISSSCILMVRLGELIASAGDGTFDIVTTVGILSYNFM